MEIIDLSEDRAASIEASVNVLQSGGVVIFPTDTVYGIGALPKFPKAIERIYDFKARPVSMPLPLLLSGAHQMSEVSLHRSNNVHALANIFWPGPLTIILPNAFKEISESVNSAGTIAVRCPNHSFVRELIAITGPVATTSANLHGEATPMTLTLIAESFKDVELGIDDGECDHGTASTIIECNDTSLKIIREGPIAKEQIEEVIGSINP